VDGARADAQQGGAQGEAEREVQPADVAEGPDVDDLVDRDGGVGGDEADRGQHGHGEQQRHGALGALGGLLVDVLAARLVRRQPRVGERLLSHLRHLQRAVLLLGRRV
jgi:hypothetical protein